MNASRRVMNSLLSRRSFANLSPSTSYIFDARYTPRNLLKQRAMFSTFVRPDPVRTPNSVYLVSPLGLPIASLQTPKVFVRTLRRHHPELIRRVDEIRDKYVIEKYEKVESLKEVAKTQLNTDLSPEFKAALQTLVDSGAARTIPELTKVIDEGTKSEIALPEPYVPLQERHFRQPSLYLTEFKFLRGQLYFCEEKYDDALEDFTAIIKAGKELVTESYIERSHCRSFLGDIDEAIDDVSKAIKLDPKNDKYYHERAWFYLDNYEPADAIKDFTSAIRYKPTQQYYLDRAGTYVNMKTKQEEVILDLTSALELGPDSWENHFFRAMIYIDRVGGTPLAKEELKKALSLEPDMMNHIRHDEQKWEVYNNVAQLLADEGWYIGKDDEVEGEYEITGVKDKENGENDNPESEYTQNSANAKVEEEVAEAEIVSTKDGKK